MRRIASVTAVFLSGLLLGVLATSHVWIITGRLLRESALAEYQHEQIILASRARRSNDTLHQVIHSMNVADAQAELGFRWLQRSRSEDYWSWFSFPWSSFLSIWDMDPYMASSEKLEKGRRILEAQYRAQGALALEQFGRPDLANEQWKLAAELMPGWTLEKHRGFARSHPWSYDEDYEAVYLDAATYQEFAAALQRLRSSNEIAE